MLTISDPKPTTEVLLVHVPYPGRLKFDGAPSSLLAAATPLASALGADGRADRVGIIDPRADDSAYYAALEDALRGGNVRVVCLSSSTAAIEVTARTVRFVREMLGERVLIIVGGPHEDDVEEKVAQRIAGVDLSIAGEVEHVLAAVVQAYLEDDDTPGEFSRSLPAKLGDLGVVAGQGTITSAHWPPPATRPLDFGKVTLDELPPRAHAIRPIRFSVFDATFTVPLMVSRGCTYGRCTFCAESSPDMRARVLTEFEWLRDVIDRHRGAALYFQDSIFPTTPAVRSALLPMLRELGVEWGCQVYLPTLSRRWLGELALHGCRYIYTGLESASDEVLQATGKNALHAELAVDRLRWTTAHGIRVGVSLMFGAMRDNATAIESEASVDSTIRLAHRIQDAGVAVAGYYPNVQTVLPGTQLARALAQSGYDLDFYRVPKCEAFAGLEDGAYGYNFVTCGAKVDDRLVRSILQASEHLVALAAKPLAHSW